MVLNVGELPGLAAVDLAHGLERLVCAFPEAVSR